MNDNDIKKLYDARDEEIKELLYDLARAKTWDAKWEILYSFAQTHIVCVEDLAHE